MGKTNAKKMKVYRYYWVLRHEPKRFWKALSYKYPWSKRPRILEAFRYVWENPPCFDIEMEDMQEKLMNGKLNLYNLTPKPKKLGRR